MRKRKKALLYKSVVLLFLFVQLSYVFLIKLPQPTYAVVTNFSAGNVTLSNSRLSYRGMVGTASSASDNKFTVSASPASPATDANTSDLFINDVVCFNNPSSNGCASQTTYTVNSVPTSLQFNVSAAVANAMTAGTDVVATQSARWTVTFTPRTQVPSGGFLRLTIPNTGTTINDGISDSGGFDSSKLTTSNINAAITPTGFTKSATTLTTNASVSTVILMTLSSVLAAGTSYSFVMGDASDTTLRFINPSPASSSHTAGVADTYSLTLQSEDASNNALDKTIFKVAPVDGVQVSATVEQTISYTIAGVATSTSACGTTTGVTTTATSVPFGSITSFNAFTDAAQTHTITTNATAGYTLTTQYDQQLTRVGGGGTAIPDTVCDLGPCTTAGSRKWNTTSTNGFGYSLANVSGTDAAFTNISCADAVACYKPFSSSAVQIMSNAGTVSASQIYMCPRLNVASTQPAAIYVNTLTFIATPRF